MSHRSRRCFAAVVFLLMSDHLVFIVPVWLCSGCGPPGPPPTDYTVLLLQTDVGALEV